MEIKTASKWSELNDWQQQEIAYLYLNSTEYNFDDQFLEMMRVLFQKKRGFFADLRMRKIFKEVPVSELSKDAVFLKEKPDLDTFPKVKGLVSPGPRLNNVTIKQFSVADTIFYNWRQKGEEIKLQQLVASLYTFNGVFDVLKLPEVAEETDKIPLKKMYQIGVIYLSVRFNIINRYSLIFPKPKENKEEDFSPQFRKKKYTPFSKIITTMAMDERQPLGTLKECNATLLYDFLDTLQESILRNEKEQEAIKNIQNAK